jgi:hypothetical protein
MNDLYIEPEIQDYIDFVGDTDLIGDNIVTPQKINKNFDKIAKALDILLAYPDLLVDIITPTDSSFKLYFYQRIILRSMARHRQSYTVATRGASKSFNAALSRYLMAMSIPGHRTFVCTDIKEQAVAIAKQTVEDDLWVKFPLLKNEMVKLPQPGKPPRQPFVSGRGYAEYEFSHGGEFGVISVDTARGKRRHSGIIEELIEQDSVKINEKVIPVMNIGRRNLRGKFVESEPHAQKLYVTTAGYQGTFAYDKYIETLCMTAIDPDHYMAFSMSYKIPMMHGLIQELSIRELKSQPTYDADSFAREYESKWSGAMKGAAFNYATMQKARKIYRAEYKGAKNLQQNEFYVISVDMAKDGSAKTAAVVLKVRPREFNFLYQEVNAFSIDSTDYMVIANELKKAVISYEARMLAYDATGVGASIRDWLNKDTVDTNGELLAGLGIINPPEDSKKDVIKRPANLTICYEIKSSGTKASEINYLFFSRFKSGNVKLLVTTNEMLNKLKTNASFINAPQQKQKQILRPYQFTDILQEELLNLDIAEIAENGSNVLRVKRRNGAIQKDFFSALSYGVYAVHRQYELDFYKRKGKKKGFFIAMD